MPLPTQIDFLLCDGIREEKRRKLTVFGWYASNDVIVGEDISEEDINLSLTFVAVIRDGAGKWEASWTLRHKASGEETTVTPGDDFEFEVFKTEDSASVVGMQVAGKGIHKLGTNEFVFNIGSKEFIFDYTIKRGKLD